MLIDRSTILTVRGYKVGNLYVHSYGGSNFYLDPNNVATTFYPNCQVAYIQLIKVDKYWQINQYKIL